MITPDDNGLAVLEKSDHDYARNVEIIDINTGVVIRFYKHEGKLCEWSRRMSGRPAVPRELLWLPHDTYAAACRKASKTMRDHRRAANHLRCAQQIQLELKLDAENRAWLLAGHGR